MKNDINIIDVDSFSFPRKLIKDESGKVIGYTVDANDIKKIDYVDTIINDENYPLEQLPIDFQEFVISERNNKESSEIKR